MIYFKEPLKIERKKKNIFIFFLLLRAVFSLYCEKSFEKFGKVNEAFLFSDACAGLLSSLLNSLISKSVQFATDVGREYCFLRNIP